MPAPLAGPVEDVEVAVPLAAGEAVSLAKLLLEDRERGGRVRVGTRVERAQVEARLPPRRRDAEFELVGVRADEPPVAVNAYEGAEPRGEVLRVDRAL